MIRTILVPVVAAVHFNDWELLVVKVVVPQGKANIERHLGVQRELLGRFLHHFFRFGQLSTKLKLIVSVGLVDVIAKCLHVRSRVRFEVKMLVQFHPRAS